MKLSLTILIVIFAVFMVAGAAASPRETLEKNLPADPNIKEIRLDGDLGLADLSVKTHDGGDLFNANVRYDEDVVKVGIDIEKIGNSAEISLNSKHIDDHDGFDSDDNRWKLSLSRDCVWDIMFDIGVCETEMDLTGLPIERLGIDVGASECNLRFTEPSPRPIRKITVNAGAGEMDFEGIGYTDFKDLEFDCGAGEFIVDFAGLKEGYHYAHIDAGVGEITIDLPEDFPVRIEIDDSWLSSVDIYGVDIDEIEDDVYESGNFSKERGLELNIDIGIGQVTISQGDRAHKLKSKHRRRYGDDGKLGYNYGGEKIIRLSNGENLILREPEFPAIPEIPRVAALPELNFFIPDVEVPDIQDITPFIELPETDLEPLIEIPEIPPIPSISGDEGGKYIIRSKIPE